MDINSLLSPQDSPATETPPPPPLLPHGANPQAGVGRSPAKRTRRQMPSRTSSNMSQLSPLSQQHPQLTSSPAPPPPPHHQQQQQQQYHDQLPLHPATAYQQQHAQPPPPPPPQQQQQYVAAYTNGRGVHSATQTPTPPAFDHRAQLGSPRDARMTGTPPHMVHRQASTPGMEALADLATMQHVQQTARQQSIAQRPSISLQNIPRTISGESNVSMHSNPEPPKPKPRVFVSSRLDAASLDALNQLEKALIENPFDYYSHVSFISILHQGLQNVLHATGPYPGAALSYELLPVLRNAYQAMDEKYNLGERLWQHRIQDEMAIAQTIEERMAVLELCSKATNEEPFSARLWLMYGDYIARLISCSWDPNSPERWSEEDKAMGKELFTGEMLMDVFKRGAEFVKFDVADSGMIWDRYLDLLLEDLQRHFSPDKARQVSAIFSERLSQPHATWANTLSKFSTFNSQYNQASYEAIMEHTVAQNSRVKEIYAHREEYEFALMKAMQAQDQGAEYHAMTRYLKWEKKTIGVSSFPLVNALYERSHVRFPVDASLWEDHVEFLLWQKKRSVSLLDVLERATRHCPWSGNLWALRILTLEAEGSSHRDIEHVKHSATRTGMLEHADIEELINVQTAWCGYLRRKAFDNPNATEDDPDIAEVGIRSALEMVDHIGRRKYDKDWQGDPKYRLECIHIKYWTQLGRPEEARAIWDSLVKRQQDSYEFWDRYYKWEMVAGTKELGVHRQFNPCRATSVLERGLKRLTTLDYPESLIEQYVNHCEQHESVLKVRSALFEKRRADNIVSIRRAKDKAAAEAAAPQVYQQTDGSSKRKRDESIDEGEALNAKKTKSEEAKGSPAVLASTEAAARAPSEAPSATTTQKRDREHTVIIVRNLPADVTQTKIRKFFTDAGKVRDITTKNEGASITATVEFEAPEEADYALLKATKGFEGRAITITRGENTTLYVTNYPPHADDAYLRRLFSPFGEILDIRLPSLKYDAHRRFAYLQFATATDAREASKAIDGKEIDGLKIVAKISDPDRKKKRAGATDEGREVYIRHLTYTLKQSDIHDAFIKFGAIEHIRLPTVDYGRNKGNNKGFGFIVYDSKENAKKAVAEMNGKELAGFKIEVEIAKSKEEVKPKVKSEIINRDASEPAAFGKGENKVVQAKAQAMSDVDSASGHQQQQKQPALDSSDSNLAPVQDRSIGLLGVPDTVTDARIATLLKDTPPLHTFRKITLMPQHGGAIVEFADVASVGKAGLLLDGKEIVEGRKIRVGTVPELKKEKAEYRPGAAFAGQKQVKRPVQPGPRGAARGRGRGGVSLGGRGKPGLGSHRTVGDKDEGEKKEFKSNDAFRAMLLAGKKDEGAKEAEGTEKSGDDAKAQNQNTVETVAKEKDQDVEMKEEGPANEADAKPAAAA